MWLLNLDIIRSLQALGPHQSCLGHIIMDIQTMLASLSWFYHLCEPCSLRSKMCCTIIFIQVCQTYFWWCFLDWRLTSSCYEDFVFWFGFYSIINKIVPVSPQKKRFTWLNIKNKTKSTSQLWEAPSDHSDPIFSAPVRPILI